jgi:hypothetical protein
MTETSDGEKAQIGTPIRSLTSSSIAKKPDETQVVINSGFLHDSIAFLMPFIQNYYTKPSPQSLSSHVAIATEGCKQLTYCSICLFFVMLVLFLIFYIVKVIY